MVSDLRRLGDIDLAARVKSFLPAHWGDDDWAIVFHAENLGAHVDFAHVDQTARAQLEFQEALAIRAQSYLIVDARGHVAEMRWWNVHAADRLKIEHVDRLLGTLDEVFRSHRRPYDRVGKFGGRGRPFACESVKASVSEQWTGGHEL